MRGRVLQAFRRAVDEGIPPEAVAEVIRTIAGSNSPRLRYRVGSDSVWLPRVKALVSETSFAKGVRKKFDLDKEKKP
jgi:hypothetical protein